jgi:NTP pyrophosphatase (non-canonical NTP hydrolase)
MAKTIRELQQLHGEWADRNFPTAPSWQPLLGMVEEVGEISHAYLKRAQEIRYTSEEADLKLRDGCADLFIFLLDFTRREGWDLQEIIEETLTEVLQRDWVNRPLDAHRAGEIP